VDERVVAFCFLATNLMVDEINGEGVFVHGRQSGITTTWRDVYACAMVTPVVQEYSRRRLV
jgi:hypothetical protein